MNRCKRLLAMMLALTMLCCLMPILAEEPGGGTDEETSEVTTPPATEAPKPTDPPATDAPQPTDPPATDAPQPTDPPATETSSPTDIPSGDPTAAPEGTPSGDPTATPEGTSSGDPTATPEGTSSGDPTATPEATTSGDPTVTPESTSSVDPTATPEGTSSGDPTATPAAESTAGPIATPEAEPTNTPDGTYTLTLIPNGSYSEDENIYVYSFSSDSTKLNFTIQTESSFDEYHAAVTDGNNQNVPDVVLSGQSIEVTLTEAGSYTVSVTGYVGGTEKAKTALSIRLQKTDPAEPTATPTATPAPSDMPAGPNGGRNGMPHGFSGFKGSFGKRRNSGETAEADDTNAIKAGKALTSLHARGNRSMLGDDCIELENLNGSTYALYLVDEEVPDVQLNNGEDYFSIAVEDETLHLTGMCETAEWSASLYSLETLNRSGIKLLKLQNVNTWDTVSTDLTLQGYYYGKLRSQGYVSKDMQLRIRDSETWIVVDDETYQIEADGSLMPKP